MIHWEEFWEKICGSFCTANEARKWAEIFASRFFAQTSARVIKICRHNFALGKVRRKINIMDPPPAHSLPALLLFCPFPPPLYPCVSRTIHHSFPLLSLKKGERKQSMRGSSYCLVLGRACCAFDLTCLLATMSSAQVPKASVSYISICRLSYMYF